MQKIQLDTDTAEGADLLRRAGIDATGGGFFTVEYGGDPKASEGLKPALVIGAKRNEGGKETFPPPPPAAPSRGLASGFEPTDKRARKL